MDGIELKTDSLRRWVMYNRDTYGDGRMFLKAEQKQAAEEGKKFSQRAYADVWARDTALVQRVRTFLGKNFYWHQRLAKNGADLEVIRTLQSMIRGESVVLIAEKPPTAAGGIDQAPMHQRPLSFREQLMTRVGMSYDAATAYIARYDAMVDEIDAVVARDAAKRLAALPADGASDVAEMTTPLGNAEPFEYAEDIAAGEESMTAWLPVEGGPANTWVENPSGSGQLRFYDGDGNAAIDIDCDHDHGFGNPHWHQWTDGARDKGNPMSTLCY